MDDPQELVDVLKGLAVKPECSVCGKNNWSKVPTVGLLLSEASPDPEHNSVRVLVMGCNYCGYVQQHLVQVLERHVESH